MADVITVKVAGLQQLGEQMAKMRADIATKLAAKAVGAGARLIRDAAIVNAPRWPVPHKLEGVIVPPGNLKKNIVAKKIKSPLTAEYIVTVRGKRKDFYAARYGRLVEFGVPAHGIPANSFLRKAFDTKKQEAADKIINTLRDGIVKTSEDLGTSLRKDLGIE